MENARIIKLESPLTVSTANFEEAFGEFSEARGRGRARRTERRLQRISNRQQVRSARAQARIQNRAERQAARQEKRTANMEMRQARRTARKTARVERRGIGQEPEQAMDEQTATEMEQPTTGGAGFADETATTTGGGGSSYGYGDEEPVGEEGAGEGESETTEDSDIASAEEEAAENGEYFDGFDGGNTEGINYEDLGSLEEVYAMQDDDFYSFDGDTFDSANGKRTRTRRRAKISPKVKNAATKSEWNKEMVSRLQAQANQISDILATEPMDEGKAKRLGIHRAKLQEAITLHKDRATGFDGMLSDYINFDGDNFEYASGRKKGQAKKAKNEVKRKRRAEVRAAKKLARKARAVARKNKRMAKKPMRRNLTEVEQGLDPQISENRIEIPAQALNYGGNPDTIEKESNATGIIAIDGMDNFDAPTEYTYSSADGLKNVNWKGVIIGVAVAGLAIWGAKKAKLF